MVVGFVSFITKSIFMEKEMAGMEDFVGEEVFIAPADPVVIELNRLQNQLKGICFMGMIALFFVYLWLSSVFWVMWQLVSLYLSFGSFVL